MKRSPLNRKTPLKATTPLKRTPFKRKRQSDAKWRSVRKKVLDGSRGMCQARWDVCAGRAVHVHHIQRRSQGGTDNPSNLLAVCAQCHDAIHRNVAKAAKLGHLFLTKGLQES